MKVDKDKLKAARERAGVSTTQVATVAGVGTRAVQKWEEGRVVNVNINIVKAVAKFLGVKPEDIARER